MKEENKIILYQDDNEITRVSVRFADEDLWLTQNQLADIYQTSKSNVSEHIKHIFEDGELDKKRLSNNKKLRGLFFCAKIAVFKQPSLRKRILLRNNINRGAYKAFF